MRHTKLLSACRTRAYMHCANAYTHSSGNRRRSRTHSATVHGLEGTITPSVKECSMKILIAPRLIAATALGCALFAVGSAAQADVYFSAGGPTYLQSAPGFVPPDRVYVNPEAAFVAPYAPAYVTPQYSWEQRQEWRRRYWEHRRWERRRWEHSQWERRHHRDWDENDD